MNLKTKQKMSPIRSGSFKPTDIKEEDRDYYLERRYPAFLEKLDTKGRNGIQKER